MGSQVFCHLCKLAFHKSCINDSGLAKKGKWECTACSLEKAKTPAKKSVKKRDEKREKKSKPKPEPKPIELKQSVLKLGQPKKVAEKPALSSAELERIQKAQVLQQQLNAFSQAYPDLVEKGQIKYPIEDQLLLKMPELHGTTNLKDKPVPRKVLLAGD